MDYEPDIVHASRGGWETKGESGSDLQMVTEGEVEGEEDREIVAREWFRPGWISEQLSCSQQLKEMWNYAEKQQK